MPDFCVYKTIRKRKVYVTTNNVIHKSKKVSCWMDFDLISFIDGLAKDLSQTRSKVMGDILENFKLDQEIKQREFELEGIDN